MQVRIVERENGSTVAVAWLEERSHPTNEEARLAVSTDGGATFAADEMVGFGSASSVDVDYLDLWVGGGSITIALTDNRSSLGSLDELHLWRRPVSLLTILDETPKRIRFDGSENSVTDEPEAFRV